MPLGPPMMLRNTQPGPLVFSPRGESDDYLEFAGAGDPSGNDYQAVPGELQNHVQMRRIMTLGLLELAEDQSVIETAKAGHRAQWDHAQEQRTATATASLDQQAENDILMRECVGPALRAGERTCGTPVSQRADAVRVHPPLCQAHKHLDGQFKAEQTGRQTATGPEVVWVKASPST